MNRELLQALAVTAEMCGGNPMSEPTVRQFVADLEQYPVQQVLRALERCRRELQRPLTLGAVVERIDDGRPGADEAWAMLPADESQTIVWFAEMVEAWGIAARVEDKQAARMAFRDCYNRLVAQARERKDPVAWFVSLGHDPNGRESVLMEAVRKGRLTVDHVNRVLLPYHQSTERERLALARGAAMLEDKREPVPGKVLALVGRKVLALVGRKAS